jgi:hypothetical protein
MPIPTAESTSMEALRVRKQFGIVKSGESAHGSKQTKSHGAAMSASDPKRTSGGVFKAENVLPLFFMLITVQPSFGFVKQLLAKGTYLAVGKPLGRSKCLFARRVVVQNKGNCLPRNFGLMELTCQLTRPLTPWFHRLIFSSWQR